MARRTADSTALAPDIGNAPGAPSRWTTERSSEWQPLRPKLVVEVRYDHVTGNRFRHGTKLLRWRPDKSPKQCTFVQIQPPARPPAAPAPAGKRTGKRKSHYISPSP